jgi:hypothetical protein
MASTLTIDQYLQATLPNFTFDDVFIEKALLKYGVESGTLASAVGERERDLAEAMMWDAAAGFISGGGSSVKIDNRSVSSSSYSATDADRAAWRSKAEQLRAKWGEVIKTEGDIYDASYLWR